MVVSGISDTYFAQPLRFMLAIVINTNVTQLFALMAFNLT